MSPEEVIARAIHDLFDPYDKAAAEVTSRILSALKAAGLVVVPESIDEVTADDMELPYVDVQLERPQRYENGVLGIKSRVAVYRAMIRAAISPDAPVPADPARRD